VKTPRWHSCTVLQVGGDSRQVWQFATGNGEVTLNAEARLPVDNALPAKMVSKDWRTLWQKKLNIAWLPIEQVFLRVIQVPKCEFPELLSMVELQLEKLSPLPVNEIVWSVEPAPGASADLQTAIVIIVERSLVEDFLGKLEGDGYLADRLELPLLHQLLATPVSGDGAWVFLNPSATRTVCLVAWWCGGTLTSLNLLNLPAGESGADVLADQLTKIAWAGELEGWLTGRPQWHLVADDDAGAAWEPVLRPWAGESVEVHPLPTSPSLAAWTARRAARAETKLNLLPPEYTARYRQQFVDRLWMGGLVAVTLLYLAGVVIYFGALEVLKYQKGKVDNQVAVLSGAYTNALQLKAKLTTLQEQVALRYAALDCWKIAAELLPTELTLELFNFSGGDKVNLRGTAQADQRTKVIDYNSAMSKATLNGTLLFSTVNPASITSSPGSPVVGWSFECALRPIE
jgi:hypothetical protein